MKVYTAIPQYPPDKPSYVTIKMTPEEAEQLYRVLQVIERPIFDIGAVQELHAALVDWRKE